MKKILIIKSHTMDNSYCYALADSYIKGVQEAGHEVRQIKLTDLQLESYLKHQHAKGYTLSEDLLNAQQLITWSDELVFVYPTWWATPPALLKVFIEIVFHSGFAFKYQKSTGLAPKWDKYLVGKTGRIIATMDSPSWYYRWFVGDPGYKMMKDIMVFCGIKPLGRSYFGSVKMSSNARRLKWLTRAYQIGLAEK